MCQCVDSPVWCVFGCDAQSGCSQVVLSVLCVAYMYTVSLGHCGCVLVCFCGCFVDGVLHCNVRVVCLCCA